MKTFKEFIKEVEKILSNDANHAAECLQKLDKEGLTSDVCIDVVLLNKHDFLIDKMKLINLNHKAIQFAETLSDNYDLKKLISTINEVIERAIRVVIITNKEENDMYQPISDDESKASFTQVFTKATDDVYSFFKQVKSKLSQVPEEVAAKVNAVTGAISTAIERNKEERQARANTTDAERGAILTDNKSVSYDSSVPRNGI